MGERKKKPPHRQHSLVQVPSLKARTEVYERVEEDLELIETQLLPLYGNRPWKVIVSVKDSLDDKGHPKPPYFSWSEKGRLELAVYPHLWEKIPFRQKFPGKPQFLPEDILPKDPISSGVSEVAWEERWRVPLPQISLKWISPLHERFNTRKAAWERAVQLAHQEISIRKVLEGVNARGKPAAQPPTRKAVLQAGKWRFERDGLWVVGQEEEWQYKRLQAKEDAANGDGKPAEAARKMSGLAYYIQCKRKAHQRKRLNEMKRPGMFVQELVEEKTENTSGFNSAVKDLSVKASTTEVSTDLDVTKKDVSLNGALVADLSNTAAQTPGSSSSAAPYECGKANTETRVDVSEANASTGRDGAIPASGKSLVGLEKNTNSKEKEIVNCISTKSSASNSSRQPQASLGGSEMNTEENAAVSINTHSNRPIACQESNAPIPGNVKEAVIEPVSGALKDSTIVGGEAPGSKVSFTLRDAERELRNAWKELSDEERDGWVKQARMLGVEEKSGQQSESAVEPVDSSSAVVSPSPPHPAAGSASPLLLEVTKHTPAAAKTPSNHNIKPGPSLKWRLSTEQVKVCYEAGVDHYNQIMETVKVRDLTRELQDGFDLLRERGRGRYDMELPVFDTPEFEFLTDLKKAPWMPVVREILGKDVVLIHKGMFLALPDAEGQVYHQDGVHLTKQYQKPCHAINVFIPLVDITTQGTEFCLGSHILDQEDWDREFVYTPRVEAGNPIIFDYRLGHRGLPNSTASIRPVVYCTYAATADGKEFRDSVNFSRKRYRAIGDLVDKAPTREERALKRERRSTGHENQEGM